MSDSEPILQHAPPPGRTPESPAPRATAWSPRFWAAVGVLSATAVGLGAVTEVVRRAEISPYPMIALRAYRSAVSLGGLPEALIGSFSVPVEHSIPRGASLAGLLERAGLDGTDAYRASQAALDVLDPTTLRAGASYTTFVDAEAHIQRVVFPRGDLGLVTLDRRGDGWRSDWRELERRVDVATVEGFLETSLEAAMVRAGAPGNLAYRLGDVFQWDLDFTRDLRVGDSFRIVFERVSIEGRSERIGDVLAVAYENQGRALEAFRFEDLGYYDAEGRPLRKQFLRSPLAFSRVTSRFSSRRFHPVLKVHRPHYGVDYGAPVGTPVRVTANGTVVSAGWSKGGGNVVKVRHPNGYVTSYLHLSKFSSLAKKGRRVQQGQVVGFVGSTGLSTGPHLDYRVQKAGRYMDPLSLKSEPAPPLADDDLTRFERELGRLKGLLDRSRSLMTAAG